MECDICLIEWNSERRIPRLLNCGHTYCELCLISIIITAKNKGKGVACPSCNTKQKELQDESDVKKLIKNYNLLKITEKIDLRKSQQSFFTENDEKIEMSFLKKTRKESSEYYCDCSSPIKGKSSKNLNYSTVSNTKSNYCEKCNSQNGEINNLRKFKMKIERSENKIMMVRHEIDRMNEFLISYDEEFEQTNKRKIDEIYTFLFKSLQSSYNSALQIFEQCKSEQKQQTDNLMVELNEIKKELSLLERDVIDFSRFEENSIKNNQKNLNKIISKLDNLINYDLELNLLSLKIGSKDNSQIHKITNMIKESLSIDLEFAMFGGESPSVKHILQKEKFWGCVCGELNNSYDDPKCRNCEKFIKLDFVIPSKKEIIDRRRNIEYDEFFEKYNQSLNLSNEIMYLIDIEWFNSWKLFMSAENNLNHIEMLYPGPISNYNLIDISKNDSNQYNLRKNLIVDTHYISVSEVIWRFLQNNYQGGPELKLNSDLDLSSNKPHNYIRNKPKSNSSKKIYLNQKLNDNQYILETEHEKIDYKNETFAMTVVSEGFANEIKSYKSDVNSNFPLFKNKIHEDVEIEITSQLHQILMSNRNNSNLKMKK